uniref:Uncharacterized protein n=1 Tax=Arundo donax TaxID=35708 RepID=A0A0A9BZW8_ARUDO
MANQLTYELLLFLLNLQGSWFCPL